MPRPCSRSPRPDIAISGPSESVRAWLRKVWHRSQNTEVIAVAGLVEGIVVVVWVVEGLKVLVVDLVVMVVVVAGLVLVLAGGDWLPVESQRSYSQPSFPRPPPHQPAGGDLSN